VAAWEARLPGWNSYEPYHLLYFTPQTLRSAAKKAGFEIQHLTTRESFSGWFLAILRTLLKKSRLERPHEEPSANTPMLPSFIESAYRSAMVTWGLLLLPLRWLQELRGRGDEIVLLAKYESNAN
jgi:hypothetical protein